VCSSDLDVALRAAPQAGKNDVRDLVGRNPFDGARVANVSSGVADDLGLTDGEGVVVLSIRSGSTAARLGLQPGDLIVQVGRARIGSVVELEAQLQERQRLWQLVLKRGEQLLHIQVSG
jgi:S1-C subfamily serine protease